MSLLRTIRWLSLIAAVGSAILLAQAFLRQPTDRQCEVTQEDVPCSLRGMRLPGLSLQLAHNTYEVGRIAHSRGARAVLRSGIQRDYFVIAVYATLFVALGLLIGRSNPTAGALVVACALGAALLDVAENVLMTAELATKELTPPMVQRVLWTASAKWLLLFAVAAGLSALFLRQQSLLLKLAGVGFIAAGFIGTYGIAVHRPFVEMAFLLLLAGIVVLGLVLLLSPQQFATAHDD